MRENIAGAVAALCVVILPLKASAQADNCSLKLIASVDIKFDETRLNPLLPVTLGGRAAYMLLDTGAVFSMISAKTADELSLPRKQTGYQVFDVARDSSNEFVTAPLALGRMTSDHINLMVEPDSMRSGRSPGDEGIIGPDIMSHFDIDIDFGTDKLNFISPDHCEGKVVYWPASAIAVVPITLFESGHIAIPVKLDGQIQYALIDTGASTSTLTTDVASDQYGLKLGSKEVPAVGDLQGHKSETTYLHTFKTLEFEGVAVTHPEVYLIPNPTRQEVEDAAAPEVGTRISAPSRNETRVTMLVGMNVLRHLHIYIAYREHKLYITPAGTPDVSAESSPAAQQTGAAH
jgi:predicted aspartyl protease